MTAGMIDLRFPHRAAEANLTGLQAYLAQFVGEPFRFVRVSYGEELTLHFGDLQHAESPKLKDYLYGAFVLGVRGSPWILKAGAEPFVLSFPFDRENLPAGFGTQLTKEELETNPLIGPESRVLSVMPFVVKPSACIGLQLRFSDGGVFLILPDDSTEAEDDDVLSPLSDWELLTPAGLVSAGPGVEWAFEPTPVR